MFLFANLIDGIAVVLSLILTFYLWIVIARVIVSWVSADPRNPIVRFLYNATDPLFYWVRRSIPTVVGGLDFSPLIIFGAIYFLEAFLVRSLHDIAYRLRF
jgi:YggT family protein